MSDAPPLDHEQVARFLSRYLGGEAEGLIRLKGGEWSTAFAFQHNGAPLIARFSRVDEDFTKDRFASRFTATALPIPRVLDVGEAFGGYFAISERAIGRPLDSISGAEMRALLPSLFATLDAIRDADLVGTRGFGRWTGAGDAMGASWRAVLLEVKHGPAPTSRISGWRERLEASPTGMGPFDEAFARLEQVSEHLPDVRSLVHADLLNGNVLVSTHAVSAVLDWGNAMFGDFLYDLAWFVFWSPWYPAWEGIDFATEAMRHFTAIGLQVPDFEARLTASLLHIGLDGQAYQAFTGGWEDLEKTARRTLEVANAV